MSEILVCKGCGEQVGNTISPLASHTGLMLHAMLKDYTTGHKESVTLSEYEKMQQEKSPTTDSEPS